MSSEANNFGGFLRFQYEEIDDNEFNVEIDRIVLWIVTKFSLFSFLRFDPSGHFFRIFNIRQFIRVTELTFTSERGRRKGSKGEETRDKHFRTFIVIDTSNSILT